MGVSYGIPDAPGPAASRPDSQCGANARCAACQMCLAGTVFYLALWRTTGRKEFLIGLLGPALAPAWAALWRSRGGIPHFRAFASAALGFIALLLGMLVSVYRQRILGVLDPQTPGAPAAIPQVQP